MNKTPKTILIVNDDPSLLLLTRVPLERAGYRVEEASDGAEALACALRSSPPPALAIVDMHMPEMDGIQLTQNFRSNPDLRHIPIILLTATSRNITRKRRALEAGVDVFLLRPIPNQTLLETVEKLLAAG